jgi:iron complex outermembrane receptor protein
MIGGNIAVKLYVNDFILTSGINGSSFNRKHIGLTNLLDDNILYTNNGYKNDINVFVKSEYDNDVIHLLGNVQYRHADFDYKGDVPFEKINWDFINYNLGATFKVNSSLNIYTTFAHTNREPTRTDMFGGEDNFIGLVTKQHETVNDVEFGVKYFTNTFKINANLFYMDFANELIFNGEMGKNGIMLKNNVNASRRMGIELSATYQPLSWLSFTNASSLSKNQIIDENGETYKHTMSPNFMMRQSIDVNYNKFACGFVFNYRDKMNVDLLETFILNESIRCNAYASYSFKYCTVKGEVNNIFNATTFSNGIKSYTGENLYFIDAPFNFNIGVNVNF